MPSLCEVQYVFYCLPRMTGRSDLMVEVAIWVSEQQVKSKLPVLAIFARSAKKIDLSFDQT